MNRSHRSLPWYRWLRWGDYFLYILIVVVSLALFSRGPLLLGPSGGGQSADITVDGVVVKTIPADQLAQTGSFELDANGYHYTVEYEAGRIRISQADCPDQVCVQTGWVNRLGQVSACVPGHLILSVNGSPGAGEGEVTEPEVDVIIR
ncbi:MAG: NusG domain II-containing protein [Clostridia bacterium]|nr:NusG domain II-containing protein [Clostridia bacterium]NCC75532.1 NusG domain II-containing protein [Clostridia bacterium]